MNYNKKKIWISPGEVEQYLANTSQVSCLVSADKKKFSKLIICYEKKVDLVINFLKKCSHDIEAFFTNIFPKKVMDFFLFFTDRSIIFVCDVCEKRRLRQMWNSMMSRLPRSETLKNILKTYKHNILIIISWKTPVTVILVQ